MLLDIDTYEHARQSRDPHFDGRIFIGVLTTGIYCRPVCPVKLPRRENIQLYASAAAAAEAGFRPCLRCRPESAPGTPAWVGAPALIARALQRISQGALDDATIDTLAAELQISSRQLGRLFRQHLGVTPAALARTQRLHFAKKLLDETALPMSEICYAAGYGSVRRFNAAFVETYGRSPLALRRGQPSVPRDTIRLALQYRPPFAWRQMLAFLEKRSIPGVECITGNSYARTIEIDGVPGFLRITFEETGHQCMLEVSAQHTRQLFRIVQRVRQMFDLNAVSTEIESHLAADPLLEPIIERFPGTRVPVAWDGFEVAVRAVLGQQVSVKAATTLARRLVQATGRPTGPPNADEALTVLFPAAEALAEADLSGLGITGSRVAAIQHLSALVRDGQLPFDGSISTEEFVRRVTSIPGIGPWTAQYIALRALNDPDAFPDSDLILLRAAAQPGEVLKPAQLRERSEAWRPWRAYAVLFFMAELRPWSKHMNEIFYTYFDSAVGTLLLAGNGEALHVIGFPEGKGARRHAPDWLRRNGMFQEEKAQLSAYFAGELQQFDLPLAPQGTSFQQQVWQALREIPYGETRSYGDIARQIGQPTASRAVGAANGLNPIPIVIPCHRVIGSNGKMVGFGGGLATKEHLLALERNSMPFALQ